MPPAFVLHKVLKFDRDQDECFVMGSGIYTPRELYENRLALLTGKTMAWVWFCPKQLDVGSPGMVDILSLPSLLKSNHLFA